MGQQLRWERLKGVQRQLMHLIMILARLIYKGYLTVRTEEENLGSRPENAWKQPSRANSCGIILHPCSNDCVVIRYLHVLQRVSNDGLMKMRITIDFIWQCHQIVCLLAARCLTPSIRLRTWTTNRITRFPISGLLCRLLSKIRIVYFNIDTKFRKLPTMSVHTREAQKRR